MAQHYPPSGLKRSVINRGIDFTFGHHIQNSFTAETLCQWNAGISINIQPSISLFWITSNNIVIPWKRVSKLVLANIAVGTTYRGQNMAKSWASLTTDMLFNNNHRCVTNQCNDSKGLGATCHHFSICTFFIYLFLDKHFYLFICTTF